MRYLFVVVLTIFSWTIGFAQISVFPHNEDFESFSSCFESCLSPCTLSNSWNNPTTDGTDWIVDSIGTPTAGTGPSANGGADHNPGIAGGKYLYLESTSCQNASGFLETPQLDFTSGTHPYLTYWYHMYGGSMGTLHIDVSTDNGVSYTNNVVPSITSNTNIWQQAVVDLSAYGGQMIKVRFRGSIGAGSSSDMAIDDVSFYLVEQMNVGVSNIQSNDSLFCDYATNQLCVEIVNTDTISLDSGILNVRINGALFNSPFPFTSSIAAGDTGVICLGQAAIAAGDVVSAVISMPNGVPDPTVANDSLAETIVLQALPTIDITPDTMTCPGDTITIGGSPTGPVGSTFLWSNSAGYLSGTAIANPMASVTGTEMYYVQVTSDIGCVNTDSVEISNLTIPVVDAGVDVALCPSVSYTFGGTPTSATGVSFEWFGPNGNSLASVANPTLVVNNIGQYIVSVEDANTCVNTDTMVITAPANVLPNAGVDDTVCIGNSAQIGDVASTAYNYYNWSPGLLLDDSTASNPIALASSNIEYVLEVQDTFGCVLYDTMNLSTHALPLVDAGANSTICLQDSFTLGGAPTSATAISYLWMPGGLLTDSTFSNPVAAVISDTTYYLTVTDANGCVNSDSINISIDTLPQVNAGADLSICFGDAALIGGFPSGAAGSTYNWSPGTQLDDSTLSNPTYVVNSNQTFILELTDANGCQGSDTMEVTINTSSVLPSTPDTTVCLGDTFLFSSTPSAAFNTFSWSSTAYTTNVNANPIETFVTGTTEYILAATDTFGCGYVDTIMVFAYASVAVDAGSDVQVCLNDSVSLGGSPSGNAGSSFSWSASGLLNSNTLANPMAVGLSDTILVLTVIDANTCEAFDTVSLSVWSLPVIDAGNDQSACVGTSVTIGGAPSGHVSSSFSWSPGAGLSDSTIANPTYMVTDTTVFVLSVTDTNGCVSFDAISVNAFPVINLIPQNDTIVCENVSPLIGNVQPAVFTAFNWSPGILTTDSALAQTTATMTASTEYTLMATDVYGCVYYDTAQVDIQPSPIADAGADVEICFGETLSLGGAPTGPIGSSYNWSSNFAGFTNGDTNANPAVTFTTAGTFQFVVEVSDSIGCPTLDTINIIVRTPVTADAGADQIICTGDSTVIGGAPTGLANSTFTWTSSAFLSNTAAQNPATTVTDTTTFTLIVQDTFGCFGYDTLIVNTFTIPQMNAGADTSICIGESVSLGGTPTSTSLASIVWSPGLTLNDSTVSNPIATTLSNTTYTATITDLNGCTFTDNVSVSLNALPTADAGNDIEICLGETISLGGSPTGPVGATYSWTSNYGGFANGDSNANPSVAFSTSGLFEFLVEVVNLNGCASTDTVNINVRTAVAADAGPDQIICIGDSTVIGGAPTGLANSIFTWSSLAFLSDATSQNPTTTLSDTAVFTLIVQDTFGCFGYDTLSVNTFTIPQLNAGTDTSICIGESVALGGAPTSTSLASVVWSPGLTLNDSTVSNPVSTPLVNTTYTATVTDLNGCLFTDDVIVGVNALPVADAGADTLTNCAFAGFTVGGAPTGPAGSIYQWSPSNVFNFDTIANPTVLVTGNTTLFLEVEDNNGCVNFDTVEVLTYPIPNVNAGLNTVTVCEGDTAILGGSPTSTSGVTYQWSSPGLLSDPAAANPSAAYPSPMFFYVVVTDTINGCTNVDSIFADHLANPVVDAGINDTICFGDSVQVGGTPTSTNAVSYIWTPNLGTITYDTASNPFVAPIATTSYIVSAIDNQGCSGSDTVIVTVNQLPTITIITGSTPCPGDTVQVTATGGQFYQWTNNTYFSSLSIANPLVFFPDTTTVTVQVTDSNLCVNTDSLIVNTHPQPFADAGIDLDVCAGQSVQIQAVSGTSPSWSPDTSLNNAFVLNPVATPPVTTDYILTSSTGGGSCIITDTMTVNRVPLPTVSLLDTLEYCDFSLGEIAAVASEDLSFTWSVNTADLTLNNPLDSALTFSASDSGYIYLEYVSMSTGCINYDSVFLVWYPKPVATASGTPIINCIEDSIQLEAFGGDLYQWIPSLGLTDGLISNPILEVYADTSLQVIVTSNEGCSDTIDVPIAAADLVVADAGNDVEICQLDTIQLNASGGLNYQWTNDASLSNNSVANPFAYPAITKIYNVTASDQYGCIGVDNILVTVNPLPNVSAGIPKRVCLNSQVQIGGNPTGPSGASYSWSPSSSVDDATLSNPFVSPSANTMYYVTVTSNKGCKDSSSVFVTVDSLPTLNLLTEPISVCRGDSTLIEVTPGVNNYNWTPGASVTDSVGSSVSAFPNQTTVYNVVATDGRGCSSSVDVSVEIFQLPVMVQQDPAEVCLGDSVEIEVSSTTGVLYRWEPTVFVSDSMTAKTFAKPIETTDYEAFVTDENGCVNSVKQRVKVNQLPFADAGDDIATCEIDAVYLGGNKTADPGDIVSWSPEEYLDNPYALNPLALTADRKMFYLSVQNDKGCITEDSILVNADCFAVIYAPNAFTPGSNGVNDEFFLTYYRVIEPKLTIYNRWGEEVFVTEDLTVGWNGMVDNKNVEAQSEVYFWVLIYKSEDNKKLTKDGKVTLIR
jgi:gliding motility-associated-like protein